MNVKTSDLTIERDHLGGWRIYSIIGTYLETRRFYGYTKAHAVRAYKEEFNTTKKEATK